MQWIKNMKISVRLFSFFSALILFLVATGVVSLVSIRKVHEHLKEIYMVRMPGIDWLIESDRDLQQLLVSERSMMFTDSSSPLFKEFLTDHATNMKQSLERWEKYRNLKKTEKEQALIPVFEDARKKWENSTQQVISLRQSGSSDSVQKAVALSLGDAKSHFETMRDQIDKLTDINLELADKASKEAQSIYNRIFITISTMVVVASLFGIAMSIVLGLSISRPIKMAVAGLKDIAEGNGDLTLRLPVTSRDEVGELATWFNVFIEKLQGIIRDISGGVKTLASSSTELTSVSTQMNQGIRSVSNKSSAVSSASGEMSTSMNNVASAVEQSAANTNMLATASEEMSSTINEIAKNAEKAREISNQAARRAATATDNIDQLGVAANSIGKVIETITDISEQVNLLALNATIEAARAGEAGKGFAVVANEIKELAKQTADATQDIREKIEGIQGTTSITVKEITEITDVIAEVNEVVTTIAAAVEEQSAATSEIAGNVAQVSTGIQEVSENVNQSSLSVSEISKDISDVNGSMAEMSNSSSKVEISARDLSNLSEQLKAIVDQFKV